MQQRLFGGLDVEITGLQQQRDVGEKRRAGEGVAAQLRKGRGQHPQPAKRQRCCKHNDQGREDSPDPSAIEAEQAEALLVELVRDETGNQKS